MLPVLSATLHDLTSWPSLVLVTRPISSTIKTTFKFFSPGLISFIKRGGSLTPFILRQVRLRLRRHPQAGRGRGFPPSRDRGDLGRGWREGAESGYSGTGGPARTALSLKKKRKRKKKSAHKFKRKKKKKRRTTPPTNPTPNPATGRRACELPLSLDKRKKGSEGHLCPESHSHTGARPVCPRAPGRDGL